jgi:hypothetical protein
MKLKYNFVDKTKKQTPGTTIEFGRLGITAILVSLLIGDCYAFAVSVLILETIYLSYKATKARNK